MAKSQLNLQNLNDLIPISSQPAQGRLHCTDTKYFKPVPYAGLPPSRGSRSETPEALRDPHALGPPRWRGQRLHAIVDRPIPLTPSTNPSLGVSGRHQGLHRCARNGFLGPSSKVVAPTRILHHPLNKKYYITFFYENV